MTLVANLIADLAYVLLDPRISFAARSAGAAR
jgi:ABC-type microcin C transport system permease subunit YejB